MDELKLVKGADARIIVSHETYALIMQRCKEVMVHHNPQLRHVNLTQNYILWRIALRYLDIDPDTMEKERDFR